MKNNAELQQDVQNAIKCDLANDYSYAVVGHPNRKYLWILSRTPHMASDVYEGILTRLKGNGYERGKLHVTHQS